MFGLLRQKTKVNLALSITLCSFLSDKLLCAGGPFERLGDPDFFKEEPLLPRWILSKLKTI